MGAGNSIQNHREYEPPPLPFPFGPGQFPRLSGTSQDSFHSSLPTNSQSYKTRTRDGVGNEETWNSPSAPGFSSRQPRDTLLTYASQMTGWQSDYVSSVPIVNQEAMELTRTVSHLAAANQQLAGAHSALLVQLEALYLELQRLREENSSLQLAEKKLDSQELVQRIEAIEEKIEKNHVLNPKEMPEDCWRSVRKKERGENGDYIRREYKRAVERIKVLEGELKGGENRWRDEDAGADCRRREELVREIQELRGEKERLEGVNEKLRGELERVRREHEISTKNRRIEVFNERDDTANTRVIEIDENLEKNMNEIERQKNLVEKENFRLKIRLSQELEDRKKQNDELEKSLEEIRRLNGIIDSEKRTKNRNENSTDAGTSTEEDAAERPNLEEFRKDLCMKREARQRAIAAVSSEMDRLRKELDAEKEAHMETSRVLDLLKIQSEEASRKSETFSVGTTTITTDDWKNEFHEGNGIQKDAQRLTDVLKVSDELRGCIRLQIEKIDDLRYHLECEPDSNGPRIDLLKEIAKNHRETFEIREKEINRLKNVLSQIVARLGDEKFKIDVTEDLRNEHDRQVEDVRRLKSIYDERLRILVDLKDSANKELSNIQHKFKGLIREKEGVDEELKKAEEKIDHQDTEISSLESQLGLTKADCRDLQNQMSLINSLFSQMLLSASSADMDLDRLTQLLQENHDLISDMAREEGTEAAALPKLLLDIVEQVEGREKSKSIEGNSEKKEDDSQEESIANNLPKVWKVLTELLSCHAASSTTASTSSTLLSGDPNSCYKSVDTPTGPRLVISVSKTYIRLKELILEKKHLEKEMGRMKQLNSHLESKLGEQEKRLSTVSVELSKTWNIVGRMQAQHQQLHTHEKILRYELQQKRKMLQELKQELEYCREKWESARQKNTNTEIEWKNLRREFAARKALAHDSFNTSAESGFSDDRCDDSDEEEVTTEERSRAGPRRRARKESPRAPTPDTESEQPTDTDASESKTESTSSPEQRTPTPETPENPSTPESDKNEEEETMNPLDQALANVIQNLIQNENKNMEKVEEEEASETEEAKVPGNQDKIDKNLHQPQHEMHPKSPEDTKETQNHETSPSPSNSVSVFSIGPFPSGKSVQFSDPLEIGPSFVAASLFGSSEVQETAEIPSEVQKTAEIPSEVQKTAEIPSEVQKTTETSTEVQETSEIPSEVQKTAKIPFEVQKTAETPFEVQRTAKIPFEVQKTTEIPSEVQKTAKIPFEVQKAIETSSEVQNTAEIPSEVQKATEIPFEVQKTAETLFEVQKTAEIQFGVQKTAETLFEVQKAIKIPCEVQKTAEIPSEVQKATKIPFEVQKTAETSFEVQKTAEKSLETSEKKEAELRNEVQKSAEVPTTSRTISRTSEEVLAARDARLKRLEEQADWLMKKMNATSRRGSALSTRLEELHEVYGEPPVPPPMPDVLPIVRLPTDPDLTLETESREKSPNS